MQDGFTWVSKQIIKHSTTNVCQSDSQVGTDLDLLADIFDSHSPEPRQVRRIASNGKKVRW